MAVVLDDCVVETTTTTGTGDITLAGAVVGFKTFASVMTSPNDVTFYLIEAIDGSGNRTGEWETGLGTYSAANTLTRTTVHKSSNANAAVNFAAGTKRVIMSLTTAKVAYRGALVYKSADQTAANFSTGAAVQWNAEDHDTNGFHDNVTNNSRLTIPVGVSKVRLSYAIRCDSVTANADVITQLRKNGAAMTSPGNAIAIVDTSSTAPRCTVSTPVISVVLGDYFEVELLVAADSSIDIEADVSWFAIEVIE